MRRHFALSCAILPALFAGPLTVSLAAELLPNTKQAEIEALIRQLKSDDEEARDKATKSIADRALEDWDLLKSHAESEDPEVRARVRRAMTGAVQRLLPRWTERAEKEIQAHNAYRREFAQAMNGLERNAEAEACEQRIFELGLASGRIEQRMEERLRAAKELAEGGDDFKADQARIEAEFKPERDALAVEVRKVQEALRSAREKASKDSSERYKKLREAHVERDRAERPEALRLRTRLMQLRSLRREPALNLAYSADMNQAYDPRLLPFEKRLGLQIAYDNMDLPFGKAMSRIGEWAGIEIVLSPNVPAEIVASAKADMRSTEQDLRSLIADLAAMQNLECQIDPEAQRITIAPKGR